MKKVLFYMMCVVMLGACSHVERNAGSMGKYGVPDMEAQWIRDGEPLVFEGEEWLPQDRFDILMDSEVYFAGEYREVPVFIDKVDVKPYHKIFTKFGRNKFRVFKKKHRDDKSS